MLFRSERLAADPVQRREAGVAYQLVKPARAADLYACLAAGMDDYLSKPFTQQQLATVIGRWVSLPLLSEREHGDEPVVEVAPAMPLGAAPHRPRAAPSAGQINRAALDNIRALSRDDGDALVHKVIAAYVGDTPRQLHALRQALGEGDAESVRRVAHGLKSASANVGAAHLSSLCRELEQLGRSGNVDSGGPLLSDLEREFRSVRQSLHASLEKES